MAPRRRRRAIPRDRTHSEIYERVEVVEQQGADTRREVDLQTMVLQGIQNDLKGVKDSVAALVTCIGSEGVDQYGKPIGTGIVGRLMRFEGKTRAKLQLYDRWRLIGIGVGGTLMVLGPFLWWLLGDKLAVVLK